MIKVKVDNIRFNYDDNDEVVDVTVTYNGVSDDSLNRVSGSLKVSKEDYDSKDKPSELAGLVKIHLISLLQG